MMDEAFATELEKILDRESDHRPVLKPVPKHPDAKTEISLTEQWTVSECIRDELRNRVRRERQALVAEYDRGVTNLQSDYAARIEEAVAMLEVEKRLALRALADKTGRSAA